MAVIGTVERTRKAAASWSPEFSTMWLPPSRPPVPLIGVSTLSFGCSSNVVTTRRLLPGPRMSSMVTVKNSQPTLVAGNSLMLAQVGGIGVLPPSGGSAGRSSTPSRLGDRVVWAGMAKRDLSPVEALSANPFAALAKLRDQLPEGPPQAEAPPRAEAAAASPRGPARAVVRYQRKGRGGKEATVVEQLKLPQELLEAWCREIKRALGCGGAVEGENLVLGGDQRGRLPELLTAKGVRRVTSC